MELTLTEKDINKVTVQLAKELADKEIEIAKEHKPEDISEFRFIYNFDSVDSLVILFEECVKNREFPYRSHSFYMNLGHLMGREGIRGFCEDIKFPVDLGFILIPKYAVHQDILFEDPFEHKPTVDMFNSSDIQKSRNWRGNILTAIINQETEPKIYVPDMIIGGDKNRATVATFNKNDKGLYIVKEYFLI